MIMKLKGFTLIEIMVVLLTLGMLAAIVAPAVSGTKQKTIDARVLSDSTTIQSAVVRFNADANTAEKLTITNGTVLGDAVTMTVSNLWPESNANSYIKELPTAKLNTVNKVAELEIKWLDSTLTPVELATNYTAINMTLLVSGGYVADKPKSYDTVFSNTQQYHSYLWLLRKVPVGAEATGGRTVEVFKLTQVKLSSGAFSDADKLTYERVF